MARTQTGLRIIVAALSLAILQVTPGVAGEHDPAVVLAAYQEAREKERQALRAFEDAGRRVVETGKRLETASQNDAAMEAALATLANVESEILDTMEAKLKVEIKAAALREEEKKKRKAWDELAPVRDRLGPVHREAFRALDRYLRHVGREYKELAARKAEFEARLGFHGPGRSLWGRHEAAKQDLSDVLGRYDTEALDAYSAAQVRFFGTSKDYADARQAAHDTYKQYLDLRKGTAPPYVRSLKVVHEGKALLEVTWHDVGAAKDENGQPYSQHQLDALDHELRRQLTEFDVDLKDLKGEKKKIEQDIDDYREARVKIDEEVTTALRTAREMRQARLAAQTIVDVGVVLLEVVATGGIAAITHQAIDVALEKASSKILRQHGRKAPALFEIADPIRKLSHVEALGIEMREWAREEARSMYRVARKDVMSKEAALVRGRMQKALPAGGSKEAIDRAADEAARRAGAEFDKAVAAGSSDRITHAWRKRVEAWKAWEGDMADKMKLPDRFAAALLILGRKTIAGPTARPSLESGAYVKQSTEGLSSLLLPETWGTVATSLAGDGIELLVDRAGHLTATGAARLAKKAGFSWNVMKSLGYKKLSEVRTVRATDVLALTGALVKAAATGVLAEWENRAMERYVKAMADNALLSRGYNTVVKKQYLVLTVLDVLNLARAESSILHEVMLHPDSRRLHENAPPFALRKLPADVEIEVEFSTDVAPGERSKIGDAEIRWQDRSNKEGATRWRGTAHLTRPKRGITASKVSLDALDLLDRSLDSKPDTPASRGLKDATWSDYEVGVDAENYRLLIDTPPRATVTATHPDAPPVQIEVR